MPLDSLRLAGRALGYWTRRQEATAHNLANVETPGFRAERVFARLSADNGPEAVSVREARGGPLSQTGNPLDVALADDMFFVVETPNGERLTRGGSFSLNEQGELIDAEGRRLLGENGPLKFPPGPAHIDSSGTVRVGEDLIDKLRVERVGADVKMEREGSGLFVPPADRSGAPDTERGIRQGYLEGSNVTALESMVEMITIQRSFGAVQTSVRVLDGVMDRISNDIGRLG